MFVWNRFILIFVAIIAIFKYGYGLDASKIKLPDGLMQMCKDWSRRYGIYIPTGEECDQIPLTFLTTFLSSVDVMPGYMVEMFHNLLPPPPVAMSKNFPQSPPPGFMTNQGPPPNMNGRGSLGIMSPKHYTITKHLIGNYTDNGWKCKTLACLCPHLNGRLISETKTCILPNGKILKKAIRKEYRTLTDDERHRYHSAFKQLMGNGIFDEISSIHVYVAEGSNVHGRPKFWSWHRKYLKKIELELRKIDPDLFLPYWDTTLDQGIPNPYDSIMWTDDFMGRSDENGTVISGPAAHWITLSKKPLQRRNKSDGIEGELYKENDLRLVLKETQVDMPRKKSGKFKYYFECPIQLDLLETAHATAHDFIGGDMADLESASNEPVFYMLHCFIDLIYEVWRQQKDPNCHAGLIEEEPDETFGYAPRPRCSQDNIDCGSKNLFCDLSRREPRCAVKIKTGGICIGLRNEDYPCFEGSCRQNRCVDENTENISPIPADFKDKRPEEASNSNEQEDLDLINFAIKEYKLMEVMMGKPPMHHST